MTYEEFSDALGGLFAYDSGATDSGIHDERLRAKVAARLQEPDPEHWLERHVAFYLSPEGLAQGYCLEDVRAFIDWLSEHMGCDV